MADRVSYTAHGEVGFSISRFSNKNKRIETKIIGDPVRCSLVVYCPRASPALRDRGRVFGL